MNKEIDLIILLNGNYAPVRILRAKKDEYIETLKAGCRDREANLFLFFNDTYVITKHIVGWYFREVPVNVPEQMLNVVKKTLSDSQSGDSWKSSDDD